jgi:two-component system, NtrC family, sensor histidine kinase HydH
MVASTLVQDAQTARPASTVSPVRAAPPWLRGEDLLPLGYYLLVGITLAIAGYPAWRIAVLAVPALVPRVTFYLFGCGPGTRRPDPKRCLNTDADKVAWWAVLSQSSLLVMTVLAAAVTGGVRSPLLVTLIAPYFGAAMVAGDRGQTRLLLGVIGLGVALLASLPHSWIGPEIPGSLHAVLLVIAVLGVGALLAPVHAMARKWRADFARAREEMASEALTRAQSLEQIGSKLAHELKNPLTGVKALVQLGLRNPDEAASRERLEVVEGEVTRMQEILENYLMFTRPLQGMEPKRVALGPLVADALVVLSARADDARVRLYAQGDATLEADPRRLKEALLNLVANAIEATPPGGEVVVEVRPTGEEIEIVVRDTGRGMPADVLRRVGTPFFTTRDDGTGLGVVLARSVIAEHGGCLQYESETGKGTSVRITLPRVPVGGRDATRAVGG